MVWWFAMSVPLAGAEPDAGPADPAWWHDQTLAAVGLEVTSGALPDENLHPLLQAAQGQPLTPHQVRADVVTLYRVGGFSAVEASVQPWVSLPDGTPTIYLTYVVAPAPELARLDVRLTGDHRVPKRQLRDAAGLAPGQSFYLDVDEPVVVGRVRHWLAERGFPAPRIEVSATPHEDGVHVLIDVDPGEPNLVSKVAFAGPWQHVGVTEGQLRRWVRGAGVREGRPLGPDSIRDARERIRERLGRVRRGLIRKAWGYTSARVSPLPVVDVDGTHVTFAIEPGPKLQIDAVGLGVRGRSMVLDALAIDHRLRLTGAFLEDAPVDLTRWLQEEGWYAADVKVSFDPDDPEGARTLVVRADRGGRHSIGEPPPFTSSRIDMEVTFTDPSSDEQAQSLTGALRSVYTQASSGVLRREHYTDEAMDAATKVAEQFLAGRGHLDAEIEVLVPSIRARRGPANLVRRWTGISRRQRVTPRIRVALGTVTTLGALHIEGTAAEVPLPWVDEVRSELVGKPFSPQRADALARLVVDAHRAAGFVDADAIVAHQVDGQGARRTTITVTPGPLVRLRSIVTRSRRVTRRDLILRTANLEIGDPVRPVAAPRSQRRPARDTPRTLEQVRSDLVDLGVFRSVRLDLLGDGPSRDLVVTVDERPRTVIEVGGGMSTDQGLRAFVRANRLNLFGLAHGVQALAQVGLDYRSDNARNWLPDITQPEGRAAVSYTARRFPSARQQLVVDVTFRERLQERTLRIDRSGFGASLQARFGPRSRTALTTGLRVERRQLNQYDPPAVLQGEPWYTLLDSDQSAPSDWRTQEAVTLLLLHDRRDDPIRPSRGLLVSLAGEAAPGLGWADAPRTSFVKAEGRASMLVPVLGLTLRLGVGAGRIWALGDTLVPVEDRFRLGGTGSLRGFVRDGVGPHARATRSAADWPGGIGPHIDYNTRSDPDRWVPTGGDAMVSGTLEVIAPLPWLGATDWDGYALTAFIDVGNVWFLDPRVELSGSEDLDPPLVRFGTGVGGRLETPVGPLQLDIALNPQAAFATRGSTLAQVRDAWEEPRFRVHLTLGSLF